MDLSEKLIVAADFDPRKVGGFDGVRSKVLTLASELKGLGVIIKVNSFLRAYGYELIDVLHELGLKVFADLKLIDIPATMEIDAAMLLDHKPDFLTVMCCAGIDGMNVVQKTLPNTKVLGVTVLTSLNEEECQAIFTCSSEEGVLRFAHMAQDAGLGELILSPKEVDLIRSDLELQLGLNTPGIRPVWSLVEGDDQSRVLTPEQAIRNGAERVVIGRPITQAKNPREAVQKTLEEIERGLQ